MKNIKQHYCPYPFTQLTTTPTGLWKLCCSAAEAHGFVSDFKGQFEYKINETTMEKYWNSDYLNWVRDQHSQNIPIKECEACFNYEKNGSESYRQRAINEFGHVPQKLNKPISMDLKLGNLCNASCLFCDPSSSSRILNEWKQIGWDTNTPFDHGLTGPVGPEIFKTDYSWPENAQFWDQLINISSELTNLKFTGGEPLINPFMIKYLKHLVSSGLSKKMRLQTTSNGIKVPDEFLELTNHFREVQLNFSVDGFEKQNEYIRYPTQWKSWINNIDKVEKTVGSHVSLFFQHSISAYSVFGLVDYFNWLWPKKRFGFHLFQVYHPEFQQPEVLTSIEARAEADKLNEFAQSLKSTISSDRDQIVFNEIIGIVKLLNSQPDKSHLKPRLKSFLKTLDEHRKISILDYMPRAAKSIGF